MHWRLLTLFGFVFTLSILSVSPAAAKSPPNLPLPPCETVDGKKVGACPGESPELSGSASGRFGLGASLNAYIDPQVPVCDTWGKYTWVWSPSPCFAHVSAIQVVGCAYIDVTTDAFREVTSCNQALFQSSVSTTTLFEVGAAPGFSCGARSNYSTYAWGGPATQKDKIWPYVGSRALRCLVDYLGPQPDGLYGPTWVKLRASVGVARTGDGLSAGSPVSTEFYVPIDGDMRDLGPVAAFAVASSKVGDVSFQNDSFHTQDESLTYKWDFGDGETSTAEEPTHRYKEPGTYQVKLTARDESDDEDSVTIPVKVEFELLVDISASPENPKVGDEVELTLKVTNPFETTAEEFALVGSQGLRMNPDFVVHQSGPEPAAPGSLAPGETATFKYVVTPILSGRSIIEGAAQAWVKGKSVGSADTVTLQVPARIKMTLTSSVTAETQIDDEFDVTATLLNEEEKEITNIKAEPLEMEPSDIVSIVTGPTSATGTDPRVDPITLAPGATTTISWRYKADQKGVANLTARVSGTDPWTGGLFYVSAKKRIAIQTPGLELSDVRLQPGSPVPGDFGNLHGTITNIGSLDVENIKFEVEEGIYPQIYVVPGLVAKLDPAVSPEIALLAVGSAPRSFMIPLHMAIEVGNLATYKMDLTMTGTVLLDGVDTEVSATEHVGGGLDLSEYWTNLLEQMKRQLLDSAFETFDGVNDWGDKSTLGGAVVGSSEGVLGAFQKLGDGLLKTNDLIGVTVGSGGENLTTSGKAIVQSAREYYNTTSLKKMAVDLAEAEIKLSNAGVKVLADWMFKVDQAHAKGDVREVARLISESGTNVALVAGGEIAVERVSAKLFTHLAELPLARKTAAYFKRAPDADAPDELPPADAYDLEGTDLRDMPTGVRITGETVAKAGITADEHAWMIETAKKHGVAFFVRPRPKDAAKHALAGFNAKPLDVKIKSVNDIDAKWLGYDDYLEKKGLVVLREPKNPFDALFEAVDNGELEWDSKEVNEVIDRYMNRLAEWKKKDEWLAKKNAMNGGKGIKIKRYGKEIETKIYLDDDGLMRFSYNNQPVYSDIDVLHIARPNGTPIPPKLHQKIMESAGWGFDAQHGDTISSFDFDNWEEAKPFIDQYSREHMRGGDPLVIVQPDVTTLGYVESVSIPDAVEGKGYDLYNQASATYEGAGIQ